MYLCKAQLRIASLYVIVQQLIACVFISPKEKISGYSCLSC